MKTRAVILAFAIALCAACATTTESNRRDPHASLAPKPVIAAPERVSVAEYLEFLDSLAASLSANEPRELNTMEVESYRRVDAALRAQLEGVENIDELSTDRQARVFNLHEELQAIVIGDPKNRVICRREHTVGTHFRQTTCMTVREFESYQEQTRNILRNMFAPGPMPVLE